MNIGKVMAVCMELCELSRRRSPLPSLWNQKYHSLITVLLKRMEISLLAELGMLWSFKRFKHIYVDRSLNTTSFAHCHFMWKKFNIVQNAYLQIN